MKTLIILGDMEVAMPDLERLITDRHDSMFFPRWRPRLLEIA
jgi:hypothetical protein